MSSGKAYVPPRVTRHRREQDYPEWTRETVKQAREAADAHSSLLSGVDRHYIAVFDGDRKFQRVSDNFCEMIGFTRDELILKRLDDVTAPDTNDIPTVFDLLSRLGYMHGLWMLVGRQGTRILVRYESWLRTDVCVEDHMEMVGAGY